MDEKKQNVVSDQNLSEELKEIQEGSDVNVKSDVGDSDDKGYVQDFSVISYIPEHTSQTYNVVPIRFDEGNILLVGTTKKDNVDAIDILNFLSSKAKIEYKLVDISQEQFDNFSKAYNTANYDIGEAISEYRSASDELGVDVGALSGGGEILFQSKEDEGGATDPNLSKIQADSPTTKLVNNIIIRAFELGASDIHTEPLKKSFLIRYRVDGDLMDAFTLPKTIHASFTAQIKIRSKIRLDEKRIPQDGNFSAVIQNKKIDFRVVTLPTKEGEKLVIRLLSSDSAKLTYDYLGFSDRTINILEQASNSSFGLILSAGPTGSGKTTTIYSILNSLDRKTKNIISLENPIEYTIDGVSQSEIRPEIGYTFASGLRSILRADPDIIFVGEIRDTETARLAVQAALTGHLVLSTIHTNTAIGAIPRLADMGIDHYLIASTLTAVVSQRLAHTFCDEKSREEIPVTAEMKKDIDDSFADLPKAYRDKLPNMDKVYRAKPTKACPTGTKGRTAITESFIVTKELSNLIYKQPTTDEVYKFLRQSGFTTMKEEAIISAANGRIPITEVSKVLHISEENIEGDDNNEDNSFVEDAHNIES